MKKAGSAKILLDISNFDIRILHDLPGIFQLMEDILMFSGINPPFSNFELKLRL
jgi:hypothetical protein